MLQTNADLQRILSMSITAPVAAEYRNQSAVAAPVSVPNTLEWTAIDLK